MVKGLGAGGEDALLELAGRCRHLNFVRLAPRKEFNNGNSVYRLAQALPAGCMLTNNGWMSALRPHRLFPLGFGSPPVEAPEWHDLGRRPGSPQTNNPSGTTYLQCGPIDAGKKPEYDTIEEWRAHNGAA